ncbi:MAG: HEAT repeat domain-containing protein, partial [Promethearchaeota archaeon]
DYEGYPENLKIAAIFMIDRITGGEVPAVEQIVKYLLNSKNPTTRTEAAKILGRLGDPRAIPSLIKALNDEKIFVRKFAIKSLVSFGDKRVIDPIITAFKDEDHFLDRDLIKCLWIFPEYRGKELWEIIELREQEKKEELPVDDFHQDIKNVEHVDANSDNGVDIREIYEFETYLSHDSESNTYQSNNSKNKSPSTTTARNEREQTIFVESSQNNYQHEILKAKNEGVPKIHKFTRQNKPNYKKDARKTGNTQDMNVESRQDQKEMLENGDDVSEIVKIDKLKSFSKFFNEGEKAYRRKEYYQALINFKQAIEIKFDAWQAWYNMALIFYDVKERKKSIECFRNCLRFKPNEIDAMLNLGSLYNETGDYKNAIKFLIRAVKQTKYIPDAWLLLGKILYKVGFHEFAHFCFNQVLLLSNDKKERKQARRFNNMILQKKPTIKPKDPRYKKLPGFPTDNLKLHFD